MEINTNPSSTKSWIWQSVAILLGLFLLLLVIDYGYKVWDNIKPSVPKNTIMITSDGKATGTPDLATINVGVVSSGDTAKVVQEDMTKKVNEITELVKKQGIDAKDITTSNFSVYPTYDYSNGQNKINGYQGNESVSIKVRGVDKSTEKLGKILSLAVENGSNQIQGVYFDFDDPDGLRQAARKQAIEKAKQKAQELADQTGLRLGKIVTVSDNSYYPEPYPNYYDRGIGGGGGAAPSISPGSQDVTASVTVTFEIK